MKNNTNYIKGEESEIRAGMIRKKINKNIFCIFINHKPSFQKPNQYPVPIFPLLKSTEILNFYLNSQSRVYKELQRQSKNKCNCFDEGIV